ncbi:MAG: hypothetical protein LH679_08275, partial [Cyanobacteria bacterium CAN_BIN43]|nr:hypothetical protein [Cyanobacteria bacterium CAN_BIN43]
MDLVSSPKNFSLEFEDGPVIWPRKQSSREEWYQNHMDAVRRYVSAGYGGDPLNKLAFGYDGSGSSALTEFLTGAGFENINARKLEAPSQLFPSKKKRGGEVQMNGIGIVFDIDALEEANYGWKAWLIFMRNLQPGNIRGCKLQEGDTKATLSGNRNEFCIAVFGLTLDPDQIKNIFADCADKGLAPTDRRFIMPPQLDSESLVDAGVVDSSGRLVQDEWSRSFHDRCKDSGWGYAPKSVTFDLTLELKSELEILRHKAVPL